MRSNTLSEALETVSWLVLLNKHVSLSMAASSPSEKVTPEASDLEPRAEEQPGASSGNSNDQDVDTLHANGDAHSPQTSAAPLENGSRRKKVSFSEPR